MPHLDPIQLATLAASTLRTVALPILWGAPYHCSDHEWIDDILNGVVREFPETAGRVLSLSGDGDADAVNAYVVEQIERYRALSPETAMEFDPVPSREAVYVMFMAGYGFDPSFDTGNNRSRGAHFWSQYADRGTNERRKHAVRIRQTVMADGGDDPLAEAEAFVARQSYAKPMASLSGGDIKATRVNPAPAPDTSRRARLRLMY